MVVCRCTYGGGGPGGGGKRVHNILYACMISVSIHRYGHEGLRGQECTNHTCHTNHTSHTNHSPRGRQKSTQHSVCMHDVSQYLWLCIGGGRTNARHVLCVRECVCVCVCVCVCEPGILCSVSSRQWGPVMCVCVSVQFGVADTGIPGLTPPLTGLRKVEASVM